MPDWVQKLLVLQDKDLRIAKLDEQLRSAPEEKAKVQATLAASEAAVAEAKKALQNDQARLKDFDNQVETIRQRMRDFQAKSAMIKSNTDYQAAMTQVKGCSDEIRGLEAKQLTVMEEIERARVLLHDRQKARDASQARVKEMMADLDTRVANCTTQVEKLRAERTAALAEVEPQVAQKYERIRTSSRKSLPDRRIFVPLKAGACDRCHLNATAQVRMNVRKAMAVSCENCGAMLYWEE